MESRAQEVSARSAKEPVTKETWVWQQAQDEDGTCERLEKGTEQRTGCG
jgi:hypothetical protein